MSRRIALLVAATSSAIVLAFLIPLGLLVRNLAASRTLADANQEARNIAILASSLNDAPSLRSVVAAVDARSPVESTVVLADGTTFGSGSVTATDPDVLRARGGSAYTAQTADGGLRIVIPVLTSDGTDVVITAITDEQLHSGVARAWATLTGLGVLLISLALLLATRIARRIATPVIRVAAVADRMRHGDLQARAPVEGPEETQALAEALNGLGDRIDELLLAERAAVGDLSHRLRTPVTALRIDVESASDSPFAERLRQHVGNLQRTIDMVVRDARRPLAHRTHATCDAGAVTAERTAYWSVLAEDQGRPFTAEIVAGPVQVALDAADLRDLIDVLVDNVFAHTPDGVPLAVTLRVSDGLAKLQVSDTGTPAGAEPPDAEGVVPGRTGLGLQIARRIAAAAGGGIETHIGDAEHGGSRVVVTLPVRGPGI